MSQQSTRKKLVFYSDDEEIDKGSPLPIRRGAKKQEASEEETGSGNSFINDEAEEDDAESGSEAVESDKGYLKLKNSTPPLRGHRPAKYTRDSDDEENIPKARNYQADDPASPKKKRTGPTAKNDSRRHQLFSDDEDKEGNRTSSIKQGRGELTNKAGTHRRQEPSDDEEIEEEQLQRGNRKGRNADSKTAVKAASAKKAVKLEIMSDSDLEIIEPPKSATKAKGGKQATVEKKETPAKSPVKQARKKAAPKSKPMIDDSDEDDAIAALKLAKGDTMYPEKRPSKVQPGNLKRSLPVTPPYKTRASSAVGEQATPSKKPRKDRDRDNDAVEHKEGPAKTSSSSAKTKGGIKNDEDDDIPGPVIIPDSEEDENDNDNVFRAVSSSKKAQVGKTPIQEKKEPAVLNQKYTNRRWTALPRPPKCEVYDENLLDESLNAAKSYDDLVALRFCDIQNSGASFNGTLTGTIIWSAWTQVLPSRDVAKLIPLLEFTQDGRFVNLSRVDPSILVGRYMSDTRHELTVNNKTAICISMGSVRESAVATDARFGGPYVSRGVRMVMHSFEWERWGSTIGEVARRSLLKTQLWNSAVTFGTQLIRREDTPSSKKVESLPAAFFNSYQSPKKKASGSSASLPNFVGQLAFTDEIPVYDARAIGKDFEWNGSVFESPGAHFSSFDLFNHGGEIPSNALCAVAYVTQIYNMPADRDSSGDKGKGKGKGKATDEEPEEIRIAPLIQWVLVLGTL